WPTTVQKFAVGSWMIAAVWPPCAPSTTVTDAARFGSALLDGSQVENSCVQFDMPIDSSTMRPPGDGAPPASRGAIADARRRPRGRCAGGGAFGRGPQSPPLKPW